MGDESSPSRQQVGVFNRELHHIEHALWTRWPALLALIALAAIYLILPGGFRVAPAWALAAAVVVVVGAFVSAHFLGRHQLIRPLALVTTGVFALAVVSSAVALVVNIKHQTAALSLLRDAALIWLANILVFALWYWEIDSGGPTRRHHEGHRSSDFLFPQTTLGEAAPAQWCPTFIDYLFLAFNTNTAFSPTDTLVLSRRAKVLMMAQALISLVVIAVLAARAINSL